VREDASAKEVRRAYRQLALERHPDKHNNSAKATEEFQQLNESYRHVIAALAEGRRPAPVTQPAPPPPAAPQPQPLNRGAPNGPRSPDQMMVTRRHTTPARSTSRIPEGYRKLGMHAALVCAALLVISLGMELRNAPGKPATVPSGDLAIRSWCNIKVDATGQLASDYVSEQSCETRCQIAKAGSDVSCSWNGVEFRSAQGSPSTAGPAPAKNPADAGVAPYSREEKDCEISLERSAGQPMSSPTRHTTEKACLSVCQERAETFRRAGVRCVWGGNEIFTQALYQPKEETAGAPLPTQYAPPGVEPRGTCFMTVAMPGNVSAVPYPNESSESCIQRCTREIVAHPLDREVTCSIGGRSLVKHIPDPLDSYLASRGPAESNEVQVGNSTLAVCEIYGSAGGLRVLAFTVTNERKECSSRCQYEFSHAIRSMEYTCSYGREEFFRKTVP
jgi:hypothetical protein